MDLHCCWPACGAQRLRPQKITFLFLPLFFSLFYKNLYFLLRSDPFPIENLHYLIIFLFASLLFLHFSIVSTFSVSDHLPLETSTFSSLLFPFLLNSLLSSRFSIVLSFFLYVLITFLVKSLLFDGFPIEISTFWPLSCCNLYFLCFSPPLHGVSQSAIAFSNSTAPPHATRGHLEPIITRRLAICTCIPQYHGAAICNPLPPSPKHYIASSNLQLHPPIHHVQPSTTLSPPLNTASSTLQPASPNNTTTSSSPRNQQPPLHADKNRDRPEPARHIFPLEIYPFSAFSCGFSVFPKSTAPLYGT